MTILRGGILFVTATRSPVCLESEKSCISNIYLKKKNLAASAGDVASISESERSPGEGNDNPLQPGKPHGRRSLVGYSPWGCRVSHDVVIEKAFSL